MPPPARAAFLPSRPAAYPSASAQIALAHAKA